MSRRVKGFPWKGDRMRFLGRNGYDAELAQACKIFEVGKEYEVRDCDVGDWSHHVAFVGIDGRYNGVMFAMVVDAGTGSANRDEQTQDTTEVVPNQSYASLVAERDALRKALERSTVAIDDWLNVYAAELCEPERVKEAEARIGEYGTLSYIANIQSQNRAALSPSHQREEGK